MSLVLFLDQCQRGKCRREQLQIQTRISSGPELSRLKETCYTASVTIRKEESNKYKQLANDNIIVGSNGLFLGGKA